MITIVCCALLCVTLCLAGSIVVCEWMQWAPWTPWKRYWDTPVPACHRWIHAFSQIPYDDDEERISYKIKKGMWLWL